MYLHACCEMPGADAAQETAHEIFVFNGAKGSNPHETPDVIKARKRAREKLSKIMDPILETRLTPYVQQRFPGKRSLVDYASTLVLGVPTLSQNHFLNTHVIMQRLFCLTVIIGPHRCVHGSCRARMHAVFLAGAQVPCRRAANARHPSRWTGLGHGRDLPK